MNARVVSHRDLVAAQLIEETIAHRFLGQQSIEGVGEVIINALRGAGYVVRHPDDPSRPPIRPPIGR